MDGRDSAQKLRAARENDLEVLALYVGFAAGLRGDGGFRRRVLRQLGARRGEAIVVRFERDGSYFRLAPDTPLTAAPGAPAGVRSGSLAESLARDTVLVAWTRARQVETRDRLRRIEALTSGQNDFAAIAAHADVASRSAYLAAARTVMLVDEIRPGLTVRRATANLEPLTDYWRLASSLGQLSLMAASAPSTRWMREMAITLPSPEWTPSFSCVRERTLWMTAVGARMTVAFGPDLADRYIPLLARPTPMRMFDAVVGLVAIAACEPALESEVLKAIRVGLRPPAGWAAGEAFVECLSRSADVALRQRKPGQFEIAFDWSSDPASPDETGLIPGVLAAAWAATVEPNELHALGGRGAPPKRLMAETLWRAWSAPRSGRAVTVH